MTRRTGLTRVVRQSKAAKARATAARKACKKQNAALVRALEAARTRSGAPFEKLIALASFIDASRAKYEKTLTEGESGLSLDTPSDVIERLQAEIDSAYEGALDDLALLAGEISK